MVLECQLPTYGMVMVWVLSGEPWQRHVVDLRIIGTRQSTSCPLLKFANRIQTLIAYFSSTPPSMWLPQTSFLTSISINSI